MGLLRSKPKTMTHVLLDECIKANEKTKTHRFSSERCVIGVLRSVCMPIHDQKVYTVMDACGIHDRMSTSSEVNGRWTGGWIDGRRVDEGWRLVAITQQVSSPWSFWWSKWLSQFPPLLYP